MGFGTCPIFGIGDLKLEVSGGFRDPLKGIHVDLICGYLLPIEGVRVDNCSVLSLSVFAGMGSRVFVNEETSACVSAYGLWKTLNPKSSIPNRGSVWYMIPVLRFLSPSKPPSKKN